MELHVSHENEYVLARTSGLIDESAENLFREHLHPLVQQPGTRLILDLSKSERINSSGLGQLVLLVADANTRSSRVVLAACSPFISEVLRQSKLDRYFDVAESVAGALDRLSDR